MRSVCSFFGILKRLCTLATTKSKVLQNMVRIIERSVREDVRFDAFQDAERVAVALVQPVRFTVLLGDLVERQAASIVRRLRVIGDAEILEAALARRFCHRFKRFRAVRGRRVAMQDAAQVLIAHKLGQLVLSRLARFRPGLRAVPAR